MTNQLLDGIELDGDDELDLGEDDTLVGRR
jgi:hypothetical protein